MGELGYEERGRRRGWCWWWGKEGCQAIFFYTLLTGHWSTNTIHLGLGQKLSPSKAWYHCNNSVLWACCVFFLMPSHTSKQPYTPDSVDEGEWLSAPLVTTELVQCVIWWNIVNYVLARVFRKKHFETWEKCSDAKCFSFYWKTGINLCRTEGNLITLANTV